jgi:VanZ family protein
MIRLAALLNAMLVMWLSLTPRPPTLPGLMPSGEDLAAHVAMHTVLAAALVMGWPGVGAAALAFSLAVALEVGQLVVPGRTFDWRDLAANLLGAALGSGSAAYLVRFIPPRWR